MVVAQMPASRFISSLGVAICYLLGDSGDLRGVCSWLIHDAGGINVEIS